MLLLLQGLKMLTEEQGLLSLETKGSRLVLMRNQDYILVGGKFPRLEKRTVKARLNEIHRLLLAL